MRAGSLGVMIWLLSLCLVGVWEVVPMAKGDTSPSTCQLERDRLVGACKTRALLGLNPTAACCARVLVTQVECVCPKVTPKLANLLPVRRTIKQIESCGRSVPHNFKCGSITTP